MRLPAKRSLYRTWQSVGLARRLHSAAEAISSPRLQEARAAAEKVASSIARALDTLASRTEELGHQLRRHGLGPIALVTANFGGIDPVKPLPVHEGVDAFYYTDSETAAATPAEVRRTWAQIIVPDYPRHDFNPRLRGRYFKHQIHRLDEVRDHRWLVWADASLSFQELRFVMEAARGLAKLEPRQRVLLVPHPDRATIREEFEFIQTEIASGNIYLERRYAQEKMSEQMAYFRARGWDPQAKLWCGTIWMIENNELVRRAWDAWWDQNLRFGMMDQLSLPVILHAHGVRPQAWDFDLWRNQHFQWITHAKLM